MITKRKFWIFINSPIIILIIGIIFEPTSGKSDKVTHKNTDNKLWEVVLQESWAQPGYKIDASKHKLNKELDMSFDVNVDKIDGKIATLRVTPHDKSESTILTLKVNETEEFSFNNRVFRLKLIKLEKNGIIWKRLASYFKIEVKSKSIESTK